MSLALILAAINTTAALNVEPQRSAMDQDCNWYLELCEEFKFSWFPKNDPGQKIHFSRRCFVIGDVIVITSVSEDSDYYVFNRGDTGQCRARISQ